MVTSDTTPQDRAVKILLEASLGFQAIRDAEDPDAPVNDKYFEDQAAFQIKALSDAGLLSSGTQEDQGDGSLRSTAFGNRSTHSVYVRVSDAPIVRTVHYPGDNINVDLDHFSGPVGIEVLGAIGVEIDGLAARAIPSFLEGDLVDQVTAALTGYRHNLGPNALSLIKDGVWKSLPLSLGEMRDIAWLLQEAGLLKGPKVSGEAVQEKA
jgi:hypothetical protein